MKGIAIRTLALLVMAVVAIGGVSYLLLIHWRRVGGAADYNYCVSRVMSACSFCSDKSNCEVVYEDESIAKSCYDLLPYRQDQMKKKDGTNCNPGDDDCVVITVSCDDYTAS